MLIWNTSAEPSSLAFVRAIPTFFLEFRNQWKMFVFMLLFLLSFSLSLTEWNTSSQMLLFFAKIPLYIAETALNSSSHIYKEWFAMKNIGFRSSTTSLQDQTIPLVNGIHTLHTCTLFSKGNSAENRNREEKWRKKQSEWIFSCSRCIAEDFLLREYYGGVEVWLPLSGATEDGRCFHLLLVCRVTKEEY